MDVYGDRKPLEVLLNECVVKLDYGIQGEGNLSNEMMFAKTALPKTGDMSISFI